MTELLSSLGKNECIKLSVPNLRDAKYFQSVWKQSAIGQQPHTQKVKQNDGSYLVYLWLGGKQRAASRRLDDSTETKLQMVLKNARKVPISLIPDIKQSKYDYMRELLLSLAKNQAIELHASNNKEADALRSMWSNLARGRQPHAQKIKQTDGSYLVYLWLGGTVLDKILEIDPRRKHF